MAAAGDSEALDRRFMAAALRLSGWNEGRTSTNPSVGTLIVRDDGAGPLIVGRGITAIGGRPHAEAEALAEAGELARGATAYVTLEPCAHHGRTPPCANALVDAGVARVVGAASDPDSRVSGKGYAILRAAGIEVVENVLATEAQDLMLAYLIRSSKKRAQVTLKLALSRDGMIGRLGAGQIMITGSVARRQAQLMRALRPIRAARQHSRGRASGWSRPKRSRARRLSRSCWRISLRAASPASWSKAAPRPRAISWRRGWSTASRSSAARSRSARRALHRRSTSATYRKISS
jgi:pyrimidine deaminase RibD-like protein